MPATDRRSPIAAALLGVAAALATLAAPAAAADHPEIPRDAIERDWIWADDDAQFADISKNWGKEAPDLKVGRFLGLEPGQPQPPTEMDDLRGQIVVIDAWAHWCGPCLRGMPKMTAMAEKYADQGVTFYAICKDDTDARTMRRAAERSGLGLPYALDDGGETFDALDVKWFPYYTVVDRNGMILASGIASNRVGDVIEAALRYQPAPAGATTRDAEAGGPTDRSEAAEPDAAVTLAPSVIDESWLERPGDAELAAMVGKPAPDFRLSRWRNTTRMDLDDMKGKIVVVDFWATWCGPCIRSIPKTNELAEKYEDDVIFLGVCVERGHERMPAVAREHGIEYPIAADTTGRTAEAYAVNSFPDYYIIDRDGILRGADIKNNKIEDAIQALLAETTTASAQ